MRVKLVAMRPELRSALTFVAAAIGVARFLA